MSAPRLVALGGFLILVGLLLGVLVAAPRVPTVIDAPSTGTPTATTPHPAGSTPSSGRLPVPGSSW